MAEALVVQKNSEFLLIALVHDRSLGGCSLHCDRTSWHHPFSMNGRSRSACRWVYCWWAAICCGSLSS
ncbi:hypothetical protein SynBIOSU31_01810 [Synechococcus sp. BIOS-U3-1]|nr:hypothetical protein SynBIOSU31_01810 [Synechococcus sp. BIOS-U3-1]